MKQILLDNKPLVVKILGIVLGFVFPMLNTKFNLGLTPDEVGMTQKIIVAAIIGYAFHQGMADHGANVDPSAPADPPKAT